MYLNENTPAMEFYISQGTDLMMDWTVFKVKNELQEKIILNRGSG
ncbi:hypothetical protein [Enterococcus sp. BWB1-3]|nr:hypothetical protein [Enterococcus sp. BWB1-3]